MKELLFHVSKGKKKINLQTSWDDYSPFNLQLADLLKKYKIPAIWFIPCSGRDEWAQITEFDKMGFEIGSHTITHKILRPCSLTDQYREIVESKDAIENVIGKPVEWFCYPRGRYSEDTVKIVRNAGYKYARTTKIGKVCHENKFEFVTTCHVYKRKEYGTMNFDEWLKKILDNGETDIHIWGHAWEIDKCGYWEKLEDLFQYLTDNYEWNN